MPYKSLWLFLTRFAQNPKYSFFVQKNSFLSHLVVEIYMENRVCTRNRRRKYVDTNYIKEKDIASS